MKLVYSDIYEVDLGAHVFVTSKYRLTKDGLIAQNIINENDIIQPRPATEEDILTVHTEEYFDKVKKLRLTMEEIIRLEAPLTEDIFFASLTSCGGTILASELALKNRVGIHIGGGFHHAYPDHGEGFCLFNDIAVAIKKLKREGRIKKAMVIDCDLHQGNGTAYIFRDDKDIFTFSMHEEDIYPYPKEKSDYDIGLLPGISDNEYLKILDDAMAKILRNREIDLIVYQAGADPYYDDQLGFLKLTKEGLKERDRLVYDYASNSNLPIVLTLGGGYAQNLNDTVEIHRNSILVFLGNSIRGY